MQFAVDVAPLERRRPVERESQGVRNFCTTHTSTHTLSNREFQASLFKRPRSFSKAVVLIGKSLLETFSRSLMSWQSDLLPYVPLGPYSHIDSMIKLLLRLARHFPLPSLPPPPSAIGCKIAVCRRREERERAKSMQALLQPLL